MPLAPLSDAALKARVAALVKNESIVPPGKTGAVIAAVNLNQVQVMLAVRAGDSWTIDLLAAYAWDGDRKVELAVTKVF